MQAIVVSFESSSELGTCLDGLASADLPITVVDNASADGSVEIARRHPSRPQVLDLGRNLGFAAAVERGLAATESETVLLVNPDCRVDAEAVAALAEALGRDAGLAAVGPRQRSGEDPPWWWTVVPRGPSFRRLLMARGAPASAEIRRGWELDRRLWRGGGATPVPALSGACLLFRRRAVEEIGGFDTGYFLFFEDLDLCHRLCAAGFRLAAVPDAVVEHRLMSSVSHLDDRGQGYFVASRRRFLERHGQSLLSWLFETRRRFRLSALGDPTVPATPCSVRWPAIPKADAYLVEIGADASFASAAACRVEEPSICLPASLIAKLPPPPLHLRVHAVDAENRLGARCEPSMEAAWA